MDDDLMCGNDIRPEAPPLSVLHKGFVNSIIILASSLYHLSLFPPLKDSDFHFSISGSKYLRALMVNRSSSRPDFSPLRPECGCRVTDGCDSCFCSEDSLYKPAAWLKIH